MLALPEWLCGRVSYRICVRTAATLIALTLCLSNSIFSSKLVSDSLLSTSARVLSSTLFAAPFNAIALRHGAKLLTVKYVIYRSVIGFRKFWIIHSIILHKMQLNPYSHSLRHRDNAHDAGTTRTLVARTLVCKKPPSRALLRACPACHTCWSKLTEAEKVCENYKGKKELIEVDQFLYEVRTVSLYRINFSGVQVFCHISKERLATFVEEYNL